MKFTELISRGADNGLVNGWTIIMLKRIFSALKQITASTNSQKNSQMNIPIIASTNSQKNSQMNIPKIWIRYHSAPNDDSRLHGQFIYQWKIEGSSKDMPSVSIEREFHFHRCLAEPISETFHRLKGRIWKYSMSVSDRQQVKEYTKNLKGIRSMQGQSTNAFTSALAENRVNIELYDLKGSKICGEVVNHEAWIQGGMFKVNDLVYFIEINAPTVTDLKLPNVLFSNFLVYPYLTLDCTKLHQCEFKWFRINEDGDSVCVGSEEMYTPSAEDVGYSLKLVVVPKAGHRVGQPVEVVSKSKITNGPELPSIMVRQKHTMQETFAQSFRVVSYNILAEVYTDTEYARHTLFSHCPAQYLDYSYRKLVIAKELLGYNSDIICLQEMDDTHFTHYYKPLLNKNGYQSEILTKRHQKIPRDWHSEEKLVDEELNEDTVTVAEGSAIFYKASKFRKIGSHDLNISETIESDPLYADIMETARSCKTAVEKLLYRSGASLQVIVLESIDSPGRRLCLCTTHLYFHPLATVVRLLQTAVAIRYLQSIKTQYEAKGCPLSLVFAGDFNTSPKCQVIPFILEKRISKTDPVWRKQEPYTLPGMELEHSLDLASACGFPEFTNYVPMFQECIDYIFYEQNRLQVQSVVPMPSEQSLTLHGPGIPNVEFPSDHVPLICDFTWR